MTVLGVDTFRSRLDLITWDAFKLSNGGTQSGATVTGGEPAFAGRHFLGGTGFLWGHGEATDCATHPSPTNLPALHLLTPAIAPMQAAVTSRQQLTGPLGNIYGAIDGKALCTRLAAALAAGEFSLPDANRVGVWLNVDPTAALSADYWAGWADQVNNFPIYSPGGAPPLLAFRACIQCRFQLVSGKLRPDPQVVTALTTARTAWPGSNTTSHGCWADAPTTNTPDWAVFSGGPVPLIWRTSHGFSHPGSALDNHFDVDVANPGGTVPNATDFMLTTQQWQPNLPGLGNYGIINQDPITAGQLAAVQAAAMPAMQDDSGNFNIPGGAVSYIGRYLQPSITIPAGVHVITRQEAEMLSAARMDTFTIWEDRSAIPANQNIGYFTAANGKADGDVAFAYCGNTLRQPPHTPVFFTVDNFDPAAGIATVPGHPSANQTAILDYIAAVKGARDDYVSTHPDRPYLIGLYTNGQVLQWCYENGDLDMFWQSASTGTSMNGFPYRPWYHANRWQFSYDALFQAAGWAALRGADPDADWGDGGRWNLRDPLLIDLEQISSVVTALAHGATFGQFGNLVLPKELQ